jgi:hypothetical protein
MSTDATPPAWAEAILRAVLKREDVETVSGDLLEEYREAVYPSRGGAGADLWYVTQVAGFAIRSVGIWGALFGVAFLLRTALDWFVPTSDFALRSLMSTGAGTAVLLTAGFWSAWRSGSLAAGLLAGGLAAAIGAAISMVGAATMLAILHDPQTMQAIDGSGGLAEVFTLPMMMVLPGLILGTVGGALGAAARRIPIH